MIRFMRLRWLWFTISALLIIPGIIGLSLWGLKYGIDFRGGTLMEVKFTEADNAKSSVIKNALSELGLTNLTIQSAGEGTVLVRTEPISDDVHKKVLETLNSKVGESQEIRFEAVGPTVSRDLTQKAIWAVVIASLVIVMYIAWAFRGVPKPASSWRFGLTAVAALLHDLLFVIGTFAILGEAFGYEIDSLFITALLTVMGFSVHDTIVVFDRIRENLKRLPSKSFNEIADFSLTQTLGRSLATSMTVIFVLLALYLFGGQTIQVFVLTLLMGITIGTYSSIFNATPLLAMWQERVNRRG